MAFDKFSFYWDIKHIYALHFGFGQNFLSPTCHALRWGAVCWQRKRVGDKRLYMPIRNWFLDLRARPDFVLHHLQIYTQLHHHWHWNLWHGCSIWGRESTRVGPFYMCIVFPKRNIFCKHLDHNIFSQRRVTLTLTFARLVNWIQQQFTHITKKRET